MGRFIFPVIVQRGLKVLRKSNKIKDQNAFPAVILKSNILDST